MNDSRYNMSFTYGSLLHQESLIVSRVYLETDDWIRTRQTVVDQNLLQIRTVSALKKISGNICLRLMALDRAELEYLSGASYQEQAYLLWIAICRRHLLIREFAIEVIRERYLAMRDDLHYADYDSFVNGKAQSNEELECIKPGTHAKLRQVLFKMLREADLLSAGHNIKPAILTDDFVRLIGSRSPDDLLVFPMPESDMRRWQR